MGEISERILIYKFLSMEVKFFKIFQIIKTKLRAIIFLPAQINAAVENGSYYLTRQIHGVKI